MIEIAACIFIAFAAAAYVADQLERTNMVVGPNVERYILYNDREVERYVRENNLIIQVIP